MIENHKNHRKNPNQNTMNHRILMTIDRERKVVNQNHQNQRKVLPVDEKKKLLRKRKNLIPVQRLKRVKNQENKNVENRARRNQNHLHRVLNKFYIFVLAL